MKSIQFNYFQFVLVPVCLLEYLIGEFPSLEIIAWTTPVLWLLYFHYTRLLYALLSAVACLTLIYSTQHQVNILHGISFHLTNLIFSFTYLLPFFINRLLYGGMPAKLRWLLLPICGVTTEYLMSLSANGTWGSVGYTQSNVYLLQVLSVTGIYGVVFIIYLIAALLFEVILSALQKKPKFGFAGFALGVLILTLGLGYIRLHTGVPARQTVKVIGFTFQGKEAWPWFQEVVWEGRETIQKQEREIRLKSALTHKLYLQETQKAIERYHPNWVIWNEASLLVLQPDYLSFLQVNSRFAKQNSVYLGVTYFLGGNDFPRSKGENHLTIFAPDGEVVYDYQKNKPVALLEPALASTNPPQVFTAAGISYSGAICADFDYPQLIRHIHSANLVFAPAADWPGIKDLHARMANARAIENGFALFRITGAGKSFMSDSKGQVLDSQYHLKRATQLLISEVPVGKSTTLYSIAGDLFSWLCIAGVILLFSYAMMSYKVKAPASLSVKTE